MAITEIAILKLRPAALTATNKPNEATTAFLRTAKQAMESYTGFPFYIFTQFEDPALVYIVGNWDTRRQHYDDWIPSDANQGLLESGKDLFDIAGLAHLDINQQESGLPSDAPVLALDWFHMTPGQKEEFIRAWEGSVSTCLKEMTAPYIVRSGWRIDGERKIEDKEEVGADGEPELEEFAAFSGWRDVGHSDSYKGSEGFSRFQQLLGLATKVESKRLIRLDL
ncbi:hypothetical protein MGYG_03359 [Nannizzia gypsea CBS 118893]|uniref:ABM domain-containing protein n=1 Tax=Arthroderma gypseum (strain ATCC MYA-4604 / CBS 118893) TaxID=535722 RepID=E4UN55_ARTGP|nr:hypothetical protein MGYG_03359 [Nannizzia gypsea CBS 118893]EFR00357.1 hypothetical protein MGYG_03359 [Nannizzia gypsea CBS 118893]